MVKKLDNEMPEEAMQIHAGMFPAELRDKEPVTAQIRMNDEWRPVRLWHYTPFGIDFINDANLNLTRGAALDLTIRLGDDETIFSGLVVNELYKSGNMILVGIKTFRPQRTETLTGDRRKAQRWTCADAYLPRGRASNPVIYNDFVKFTIQNISAGGIRFTTSMRNKFLGIGQRLDTTISLPLVGSVQATILIRTIDTTSVNGKQELAVGAQFVNPTQIFRESLAEYLLNFADGISIASLKKEGFPLKTASQWLDFTYQKTEDEYNEVLQLRYLAYKGANKLAPDKKAIDMADEFDTRARILIVKRNGKIVGSLRAMFHNDDQETDHGRYVTYPATFPKISQIVECSRICTDPEFRGSDMFHQLMAHLLLTTIKGNRRYILGGAAGDLIKVYEKCGFRQVGLSYKNQALGGIEHQLILLDTHRVALGKDITMKAWLQMYGSVFNYMVEQELIFPSSVDLMRINTWRTVDRLFGKR